MAECARDWELLEASALIIDLRSIIDPSEYGIPPGSVFVADDPEVRQDAGCDKECFKTRRILATLMKIRIWRNIDELGMMLFRANSTDILLYGKHKVDMYQG